jgi:hypothetical protein
MKRGGCELDSTTREAAVRAYSRRSPPEYLRGAYAQVKERGLFGARNGQVNGCGRASVMTTTFDVERGHNHLERSIQVG